MEYSNVALNKCLEYNFEAITELLLKQFSACGITEETVGGKNIVIKPNLVMNKPPEYAATTHPEVVRGCVRCLKKLGAGSITVAESYGGPYVESTIKAHYEGCGIKAVADDEGIFLNCETGSGTMSFPEGVRCKSFNVIDPIRNADVIVNICKLKTHSLTKMSCGVKNFFGVIPGIEKFEMHARFPEHGAFCEMLVDLCSMLCKEKTVITVCDGIVGMEGNGPTGGTPRNFGILMTSLSPFCLDLAAEKLLDFEGTVPTVNDAKRRGLCPESFDKLTTLGESAEDCITDDVVVPDADSLSILTKLPNIFGGRFAEFFSPHPEINRKKCIGCGKCAQSCPAHTIEIIERKARINHEKCIKCYCCQELCPINSVFIKKNLILKLVQKL
ncbi:MAG: DUF362 domain-containing protein [Clostridia bacterium]|nr:DUF362 domain-containing protein [Clostridia bacterium]